MVNKPTPKEIAGLNRHLKDPFPVEFDEWGSDDFKRFHEIIEGVMKTSFQEWVGMFIQTLVKIRPCVIAMVEQCKELLLVAGYTWNEEEGLWIPPNEALSAKN